MEVYRLFPNSPFNLIADSTCVTRILLRMHDVSLQLINTANVALLVVDLITLIVSCHASFFVMHIHSHTSLPGPLTEGNALADCLMMAIVSNQTFTAASEPHAFFIKTLLLYLKIMVFQCPKHA